ncbi:hypothetical protein CPB84DRAFT_1785749, partial [Gymnopilus junonius]
MARSHYILRPPLLLLCHYSAKCNDAYGIWVFHCSSTIAILGIWPSQPRINWSPRIVPSFHSGSFIFQPLSLSYLLCTKLTTKTRVSLIFAQPNPTNHPLSTHDHPTFFHYNFPPPPITQPTHIRRGRHRSQQNPSPQPQHSEAGRSGS